jgi:glycosyltransferase involved in cell wall biosynthesis
MARDPTSRVRLAVVLDTAPPWSKGGRERRYAELLPRLAAQDLSICLYTMRWWDERPTGAISYAAICPRLPLYRNGRRSILHGVVFAIGTLQLVFRGLDVIVADHMPYLQLFPLRVVAWIRRVPLVAEWHESWDAEYWRAYLGPLGVLGALIERAAERTPDLIVTDSESLARELGRNGVTASRLEVISNAVDRSTAQQTEPSPDAPEVLVVGRLIEHKRVDLALEAFARLRARTPAPRLGIIGVGPVRERLEQLARRLGVQAQVHFYGSVDDDAATWALMRGAVVLVATSEREGFGLTVAESLALGTPVVTVDCDGNEARRLVEPESTGSVVPCGDAAAVTAAIDAWIDRRDDHRALSDRFWAWHADLDWDENAARYASVLKALATRRRRR